MHDSQVSSISAPQLRHTKEAETYGTRSINLCASRDILNTATEAKSGSASVEKKGESEVEWWYWLTISPTVDCCLAAPLILNAFL
jgi:hypothetical protein